MVTSIRATEIMTTSMTPMSPVSGDGTQIWKITHNGVDTHAIHFHLFNVQLINRVGWDGAIRPPDPNELGWKETVRMNPLEDAIVALRPIAPTLPFEVPNSIRPMDVTKPLGSTMGFSGMDPNGNPVTVINQMVNFGWEYVWHCHLLGHEENDMMRPMILAVAPDAPTNLVATGAQQSTASEFDLDEQRGERDQLYHPEGNGCWLYGESDDLQDGWISDDLHRCHNRAEYDVLLQGVGLQHGWQHGGRLSLRVRRLCGFQRG